MKVNVNNVAERLEQLTPEILRQWEARVRAVVPAARRENRPTLRDHIPQFLQELAVALTGEATGATDAASADAPRSHAEQRASLPFYSLEQVIQEYSLLRSTVLHVLSEAGPLPLTDLQIILDTIDFGIAAASAHYVDLQDRALRESDERFRLLVANVKDYGIFMLDTGGHVISWNRGAEQIKGYTAEEIIGQHFSVFYPEPDRIAGRPQKGLQTAAREDRFEDEGFRLRKDGSTFYANVVITALRDQAGGLRGYAKVTRDVTERHALEAELRQRAAVLTEINQRKDEFLAMLAHELRNPLAAVVNAAKILRLFPAAEPAAGQAQQVVERQARHLTRLVDDLLDVSRISQDKIVLHKAPIQLRPLIDQVAETLRPFIDERHQLLTLFVPEQEVWVEADFIRLSQVVSNLVHNACKFSDPGKPIELGVAVEEGQVCIRVRDEGSGMEAELLPQVFEVFTQGGHAHGGLGIGLTLARRLVELHGGTISAHSDGLGKGSVFEVRLPRTCLAAAPSENRLGARGTAAPASQRRILVVDDNVDAADTLATLLSFHGHHVVCVHSGHDALAHAQSEPFDAILLDIGLPDIDGYEVARQMRQWAGLAEVQLIALTGYGQAEDQRKALAAGFDLHFTKPCDLERLQAAIVGHVPAP